MRSTATRLLILMVITVFAACADGADVQQIRLLGLQDESAHINLTEHELTVICFLSPECPLCVNYARTLRLLAERFEKDSIGFYGIFSGEWVTSDEILGYRARNGLRFTMFRDTELQLTRTLKATVTPEVFVLDTKGEVIYRGAIDNWVNGLGKKKLEVTEHYLQDALIAGLKDERPMTGRTTAVGCLIE